MKNKTLEEHNKEQREVFEKKLTKYAVSIAKQNQSLEIVERRNLCEFLETQNKALLLKERERVGEVIDEEMDMCLECGHEIYDMQRGEICEYCAIGMSGGFSEKPTVETLAEDYWRVNKVIEQIKKALCER